VNVAGDHGEPYDLGYRGLVVVVTGASGGIGEGLARALSSLGATVVAHAATRPEALHWAAALGAHSVTADLADPEATDALFADLQRRFGRVDVLFANAGRWPEPVLHLDQTSVASLRRTIDDNLWSAVFSARSFLATLRRTGPRPDGLGGAIVFTGSTAGRFGEAGHAAYAIAKAALRGAVSTLKNEIVAVDPAARVNLVEPGWTVTPTVAPAIDAALIDRVTRTMPLRRIAAVEDIVHAALFLGSSRVARHVTGEVLTVAGGMEGRVQR
jgi:3-oxoacyl-[acyl-carrier protein] reductase